MFTRYKYTADVSRCRDYKYVLWVYTRHAHVCLHCFALLVSTYYSLSTFITLDIY